MGLIPYKPLISQSFLDNIFDDLYRPIKKEFNPSLDIVERDIDYVVKLDTPGLDKSDISINVDNGYLIVKGERKEEKEYKDGKVYKTERSFGSFYKSVYLDEQIDDTSIKANYKDGVLNITLPKKERSSPKKVEIE